MTFNNDNNWNLGFWPCEGVDCRLWKRVRASPGLLGSVPLLQTLPLELLRNWDDVCSEARDSSNAVVKHPGCECDQSPRRRIVRPLKPRAPAVSPSRPLLSAGLSCGCRMEVGKTPGTPVATCCLRRNAARLATRPRHSWTLCASVLVCLFVWALCGVQEQNIQPLAFPSTELICSR